MRKSSDCFLGDRNSSSLPMACPPTPGCPNVSQPAMVGGSSNIFQPALPLQRLTLRCGQFSVPLPGSPAVRLGPRKKEGRTVIRKLKRKYQQQEMSQKSLSLSDLSDASFSSSDFEASSLPASSDSSALADSASDSSFSEAGRSWDLVRRK